MFSTEKDLRKAVPKKLPSKATPLRAQSKSETKDEVNKDELVQLEISKNDVVIRAKVECEERKVRKEQFISALRIQAWWRGRHCYKIFIQGVLENLKKRVSDVGQISMLMKSKGLTFVPPFAVTQELLTLMVYLLKQKKFRSLELLHDFSQLLLLPQLGLNSQDNLLFLINRKSEDRSRFVYFISKLPLYICEQEMNSEIGGTFLGLMRNALVPSNSVFEQNGIHIVRRIRDEILSPSFLKQLLDIFKFDLLYKKLLRITSAEDFQNTFGKTPVSADGIFRKFKSVFYDSLRNQSLLNNTFLLTLDLISQYYSQITEYSQFLFETILSVPLLPFIIDSRLLEENLMHLTTDNQYFLKALYSVLEKNISIIDELMIINDSSLNIPKGYIIIGNVLSMISFYFESDTRKTELQKNPYFFQIYLKLSKFILIDYPLIGVLQGSGGIAWQRVGSTFSAAGFPFLVSIQILQLYDTQVLQFIFSTFFPGAVKAVESGLDQYETNSDREEIRNALTNSTSFSMIKSQLDVSNSSNIWSQTSSWALRLGLVPKFNLAVSGTQKSESSWLSYFGLGGSKSTTRPQQLLENPVFPDMMDNILNHLMLLALHAANAKLDSIPWKWISFLAFSLPTVPTLWLNFQQKFLKSSSSGNNVSKFLSQFYPDRHFFVSDLRFQQPFSVLYTLIVVLRIYLIALDDFEMFEKQKPIPLHQLVSLIRIFNKLLFEVLMVEPNILSEQILTEREFSSKQDHSLEIFRGLAKNVQNVLSELHTRWSRKPFFNPRDLWIISETEKSSFRKELLASGRSNSDKMNYTECILRVLPWSIPLQDRLKYFRNEIDRERVQIQGSNDTNLMSGLGIFESQFRSKGTIVTIHRDRLLHDAMQQMMKFSRLQWKDRIVIRYIDSFGNEEKGIDVGGLFKDFVTDLTSNIIFNASFGLFVHSEDYLIFPNPFSHKLFNSPGRYEVDDIYCFIGKVLGKALYENITISPQFAYFFLAFMNGRYNFMNLISDFRTLDPELYKNLMFLKTYEGDIRDLSLSFSITDTSFGFNEEVDLIPNGSNIEVSSENKLRYIHLVAKYYLHDRLKRQASAFFSGLYEIIPVDLLNIFNPPELQVVISGSQNGIDIGDWQQNTQYTNGYHSFDPSVIRFWKILKEMSFEQQSLLLRFVTACPRSPSLGFSALSPKFTIQRVENPDDSRLPSASTCFNILKLPVYSTEKIMKEKLLYAINSKSGFDLS